MKHVTDDADEARNLNFGAKRGDFNFFAVYIFNFAVLCAKK
jgi:hypothetical protein